MIGGGGTSAKIFRILMRQNEQCIKIINKTKSGVDGASCDGVSGLRGGWAGGLSETLKCEIRNASASTEHIIYSC